MPKWFYRKSVTAESLDRDALPSSRFTHCPFCKRSLAHASDDYEAYSHDVCREFGFCVTCGWWDMHYQESGMMGEFEENSYIHAVLEQFESVDEIELAGVALCNELAVDPEKLFDISPRDFEAVVASIFKNVFDCKVELTPQTRDGGKDLICFDSERGKFIVEAKRYGKSHKVGVAVVRQLLGAMYLEDVAHGMIVTTSSFTSDATEAATLVNVRGSWLLQLADLKDIEDWLALSFDEYFDLSELDRIIDARSYAGYNGFPRTFKTAVGKTIKFGSEHRLTIA